jgi:hypothetical protein
MINPCLVWLACCGAAPLNDAVPEYVWNQLHRTFYTHKFSNGETYEHEGAFEPPWFYWAAFYTDEKFHAQAIAGLDACLQLPAEHVERQPAVPRAMLLRDLWPVFEAQTYQNLAKGDVPRRHQAELRQRVARVMRRLELTADEIKNLPDNLRAACKQRLAPPTFDTATPEAAFLPADLLDENGPWVPFAFSTQSVGALNHVEHSRYRTVFVPLIRVSDDRAATLKYLELSANPRTKVAPPKGTQLALLRRTVLPTATGGLMLTPIAESLQLIVVDPPQDRRFKFILDRAALLRGGNGLRLMTKDDRIDAYAFESGGLYPIRAQHDTDGELLPFGTWSGITAHNVGSLGHCAACHGPTVGSDLFANRGRDRDRAVAVTFEDQARLILEHKRNSFAWGMYQAERESRD